VARNLTVLGGKSTVESKFSASVKVLIFEFFQFANKKAPYGRLFRFVLNS